MLLYVLINLPVVAGSMESIKDGITVCKKLLEEMKQEIGDFAKSLGPNYTGSEVKMRTTMHGSLCRRLHGLAKEFQSLQVERKEMHKKTIMEQVRNRTVLLLRVD